ncbi:MAG: hypothetical protein AB8B89_06505 [Gammaproteobacteria bacterium]
MDEKLQVKQLAQILETSEENVIHWEYGKHPPTIQFLPKIIQYLGYCPIMTHPKSLGQKVRFKRMYEGLSAKALGHKLDIDECTLLSWERQVRFTRKTKIRLKLEAYLKD